ncbi:hypothetical protein C8R45DRAFT_941168 [Mycena sanguinolenta]|nr:hypothetical protein C8R45DRAFT_941168 [Mycena sanguinolenta]
MGEGGNRSWNGRGNRNGEEGRRETNAGGGVEARNGKEGLSRGTEGSRVEGAKREGGERQGGSGEQCRGRRRGRGAGRGNVEEGRRGEQREDERTGGAERMGSGGRTHNKKMEEGGQAERERASRQHASQGKRARVKVGWMEGRKEGRAKAWQEAYNGWRIAKEDGQEQRGGRRGEMEGRRGRESGRMTDVRAAVNEGGPQRVASHRSIELELDAHENPPEEWYRLEKWKGK